MIARLIRVFGGAIIVGSIGIFLRQLRRSQQEMNGSCHHDRAKYQAGETAKYPVTINPSTAQTCSAANQETRNGEPVAQENKRPSKHFYRKWIMVVNGILAGAAIFGGFIYHSQLVQMQSATDATTRAAKAAEDSITKSEASAHLDQRAWVAATNIDGIPKEGSEFEIKVMAKNTGKTFAKQFTMYVGLAKNLKPDFTLKPTDEGSIAILAPNSEYTATRLVPNDFGEEHRKLTKDDVEDFTSGRAELYVFGKMSYNDVFDCPHWTTFCFFLGRDLKYANCHDKGGNEADDKPCPTPTP